MESLFRKYRPQTFESMVGQKHIVSTLQNALNEGRPAHAYLFSGPRGTGKTTTARLLAKALLCEHGPTATPCGVCEQCEEIAQGLHPDVYELDAASRTGVDSIREEVINRVDLAPTRGRKKVYIIDEVHMLTVQAFNALLKTIEEPPEHVIFVLCTTDPQKVPDTILSRCQRLEFHSITAKDIEERLQFVCESEGFEYDSEALALIAKHARGGLRDALSRLEQLSVYGGRTVKLADTQQVLGEVSGDILENLVLAVASRDAGKCFATVADLMDRGSDIAQLTRDFTGFVRDIYVASVAGEGAFADRPDAGHLKELATKLGGSDRIAFMLDILGKLAYELRSSTDPRLSLEIALTRMARPQGDLTLEALSSRITQLEQLVAQLQQGIPAPAPNARAYAQAASAQSTAQQPQPVFAPGQQTQAQPAVPRQSAPVQQQPAMPGQMPGSSYIQGAVAPLPAQQPVPLGVAQPHAQPHAQPVAAEKPLPQQAASQAVPVNQAPVQAPRQPQTAVHVQTTNEALDTSGVDMAQAQKQWEQLVFEVTKTHASTGGLIRPMFGILKGKTLTIENHGANFAATMITRPQSMGVLQQAVAKVYGPGIALVFTGAGFSAGASGARPAAPAAPAQTQNAAQAQNSVSAEFASLFGNRAQSAQTVPSAAPAQKPQVQPASQPLSNSAPQPFGTNTQSSQTATAQSAPQSAPKPASPQQQTQDLPWTAPQGSSSPQNSAAPAPQGASPEPQHKETPAPKEPVAQNPATGVPLSQQAQPPSKPAQSKEASRPASVAKGPKRKNPFPLPQEIAQKAARARAKAEGKPYTPPVPEPAAQPAAQAVPSLQTSAQTAAAQSPSAVASVPVQKPAFQAQPSASATQSHTVSQGSAAQTPVPAPAPVAAQVPPAAQIPTTPQGFRAPSAQAAPIPTVQPPAGASFSPEPDNQSGFDSYNDYDQDVPLDMYDGYDEAYDEEPLAEPTGWQPVEKGSSPETDALQNLFDSAFGAGVKLTIEG